MDSGTSSKQWMRSSGKKSLDEVEICSEMNSVDVEEKANIVPDEKSAYEGIEKLKLSTTEHETSSNQSLRSGMEPLEIEQIFIMDTADGGKKDVTDLKSCLFKEESDPGPSSKEWMRNDGKKNSEEVGACAGMNSGSGEMEPEINQDEKSVDEEIRKLKLSTTERETSPKRCGKKRSDETEQVGASKMNSNGDDAVEAKNLKSGRFKKESVPESSKHWMRIDGKKCSEEVETCTGINSVGGEKKVNINQNEKSALEGIGKLKLNTTEYESSPKRWIRSGKIRSDETEQVGASIMNSNRDKKFEIDIGKGRKRKLFTMEQIPSKRRLTNTKRLEENLELPIFKLPMEVWEKIMEMVPISQWASMESISHRFQDVVHGMWGQLRQLQLDELAYKQKKEPRQVMDLALSKFLLRAPNVTSISGFAHFFDGWYPICLPMIQLLCKFENLQTIDFSGGTVVSSTNFAEYLQSSASRKCWKRLNIFDGIFGEMTINNAVNSNGNQPALNLESFKFSMETLRIFGRLLPIEWSALKKLVITKSDGYANDVLAIIRQCSQLVHLELEIPKCGEGNGQPSYGEFIQAVAELENLSVLKIIGHPCWDVAFRNALLNLIRDLRITELALMVCICDDEIIDAIIDHLPRLMSLEIDVTFCHNKASLRRLAYGMDQLKSLKLSSFRGQSVDGSIIRAICGNMSQLECLHLDFDVRNSDDYKCLAKLRNLKELRIMNRFMLCSTIETWSRFGFGSSMETLGLLLLGTSEVMDGFFKNMPRLRAIETADATNHILRAIAVYCPNLAKLDLGSSPAVTSAGIQFVINQCSQLKILKLCGHSDWFPESLAVENYRKITFKS